MADEPEHDSEMGIREIMSRAPVIPVLEIDRADRAVAIARALVDGGLPVLEVTLRTEAAPEALRLIRHEVPDAILGVGTVLGPEDLDLAASLGVSFAVSPGLTDSLAAAARKGDVPLLPGVMTPGEVMRAREYGFHCLKFFPAVQGGGVSMLKAFRGPFPDVVFCPTGGVTAQNAEDFLALPNVACVGGSWLVTRDLVEAGDWDSVRARAEAVSGTLANNVD